MTIGGWIAFVILTAIIVVISIEAGEEFNSIQSKVLTGIIAFACIVGLCFGFNWYYNNTASGQRALTDQQSELANGLERTVTIYTADGNVIAQYHGRIDIEGNDGGYVLFDFEGKRYTYYNCFVESIADIG